MKTRSTTRRALFREAHQRCFRHRNKPQNRHPTIEENHEAAFFPDDEKQHKFESNSLLTQFKHDNPWIQFKEDLPHRMFYVSGVDTISGSTDLSILEMTVDGRKIQVILSGEHHDLEPCESVAKARRSVKDPKSGPLSIVDLIKLLVGLTPFEDSKTKEIFVPFVDIFHEKWLNDPSVKPNEASVSHKIDQQFHDCLLFYYDAHYNLSEEDYQGENQDKNQSKKCIHQSRARFHVVDTRFMSPLVEFIADGIFNMVPGTQRFLEVEFPEGFAHLAKYDSEIEKKRWLPGAKRLLDKISSFFFERKLIGNKTVIDAISPESLQAEFLAFLVKAPLVSKQFKKIENEKLLKTILLFFVQKLKERLKHYSENAYPHILHLINGVRKPIMYDDLTARKMYDFMASAPYLEELFGIEALWMDSYTMSRMFRCFQPRKTKPSPSQPSCAANIIVHTGEAHTHLYHELLTFLAEQKVIQIKTLFHRNSEIGSMSSPGTPSNESCFPFDPTFKIPFNLTPSSRSE